jgi:hypothetical protein
MQHAGMGANHFQYYYGLFPMPKSQWYEFRVVPRGLSQTGLNERNLVEFAHPPASDESPCSAVGYGGSSGGRL